MVIVYIESTVNYAQLVELVRKSPLLGEGKPAVQFKCGPFTCDTVEEVWGLVRAEVQADRNASYEKLRDFAP